MQNLSVDNFPLDFTQHVYVFLIIAQIDSEEIGNCDSKEPNASLQLENIPRLSAIQRVTKYYKPYLLNQVVYPDK
jgi:hypothetical protein